jgi:hypothetical protein
VTYRTPARPRAAIIAVVALAALSPAATASAASGGGLSTQAAPSTAPATAEAPATTDAAPAPTATGLSPADTTSGTTVQAPGLGTWSAAPSTTVGTPVLVVGQFEAALANRRVQIQRQDARGGWRRATTARVRSNGRFVARWRTRAARYHQLRVVLLNADGSVPAEGAPAGGATARTAGSATTARVAVLAKTKATWYGPGFYGRRTACGQTLTKRTEGVAHRTLPCGTQVEIRRGGRSVVVPVIDRGPFANKADFDLTKNVADAVDVSGVDRVSYIVRDDLPRSR